MSRTKNKPGLRPGTAVSRGGRNSQGSVLIEALVAMLIFLIGILGMVGMQSAMTREQTESKVRAEAAFLANDIVGRMWADLTHAPSYDGSGCAAQPVCKEWQDKVAQSLPGGAGALVMDTTTKDVEIVITWKVANGQSHKFVMHTTVAKAGG